MKTKFMAAAVSALALFSTGLISPAGAIQPATKHDTYKLVLIQAVPTIKTWDLNDSFPEAKETVFGAKLTTPKGKASGYLTGSIVSEQIIELGTAGEYRHRRLTFTLPGGQMLAQGNNFYPTGETELTFNESATIAVIGGTGKYIGASGEVTTTRRSNGTYRHVFTLLK